MTADTKSHDPNHKQVDTAVHERQYAGFITLLKWSVVIVAIVSAAVIYIISN